MTKYELLFSKLSNLYSAASKAKNKEISDVWYLQYQRLEHKMLQMTIKEAMENV